MNDIPKAVLTLQRAYEYLTSNEYRQESEQKRYAQVLEMSKLMMENHPDDARWLPLAAQAYAARGDADKALDLFQLYLWMLPEEERGLYEDLSLVAFPEEQEAYRVAGDKEAFLEAFWRKRDVMLVSGGKARRAEHYRRVWYARTHFAEKVYPWDRRGEVYIRYGEPDFRACSYKANEQLPSPAVELADENSGKWGVYKQKVEIPAYGDSLQLSDLELACVASEKALSEKFRKGDMWLIPMPTRTYPKDRSVHIYYEVYNLQKDAFGQTRYRVAYAVRKDVRKGVGAYGAISYLFRRLFSSRRPATTVSYEREGSDVWEPVYFELDTKKLEEGFHEVEVRVTDLSSGETAVKEGMFLLGEKRQELTQEEQTKKDVSEMFDRQEDREDEQRRERRRERGEVPRR